ncbi:MAG: type II toxin-antitoxin system Phd/YefM family antitoxin [Candidatus Limnocylindrales bacterium]
MNTATITEAKNRLSALIDRVRSGESILILDRGVPVARLEPVAAFTDPTGRLRRLERAGVIRVGNAPPPLDLLRTPAPPLTPGASAVETLLLERRAGR